MKSLININEGILPLSAFRQNSKALLQKIKKSHESLLLTQNGHSAAVVLAPEDYERLQYQLEFFRSVAEGEKDISRKKFSAHEKVFEDLLK